MNRITQLCFVLVFGVCGVVWAAKDYTIVPGYTGCEVTYAVIEKIKESKIFVDHHFMLNVIAFTTEFGTKTIVTEGWGIWEITTTSLQIAIQFARTNGLVAQIEKILCVDWSSVDIQDMHKPMYCGITAMILIQSGGSIIPYSWKQQAMMWFTATKMQQQYKNTFVQTYTVYAKNYEKQPVGLMCMQCKSQPSDVVFVVDDSSSIDRNQYMLQKKFIQDMSEKFQIGLKDDETRVGMVFFSKKATSYNFNQANSKYALQKTLNKHRRKTGPTYTWEGIQKAEDMFMSRRWKCSFWKGCRYERNTNSGSRFSNASVRKVMVLLTDGKSSHRKKTAAAAGRFRRETSNYVNVFAIGTKGDANLDELQTIAGDPLNARKYSDFDEFLKDTNGITKMVCDSVALVPSMALNNINRGKRSAELDNVETETGLTKRGRINKMSFSFSLNALHIGHARYFCMSYQVGTILKFDWRVKTSVEVYYSFSTKHPSYLHNDFQSLETPSKGRRSTRHGTIVKPPDWSLDDICQNPPITTPLTTTTTTTSSTLPPTTSSTTTTKRRTTTKRTTTTPKPPTTTTTTAKPSNIVIDFTASICISMIPCNTCNKPKKPVPIVPPEVAGGSTAPPKVKTTTQVTGNGKGNPTQATTKSSVIGPPTVPKKPPGKTTPHPKKPTQPVIKTTTETTQFTTQKIDKVVVNPDTTAPPECDSGACVPGLSDPDDETPGPSDADNNAVDTEVNIASNAMSNFPDYKAGEMFGDEVAQNYNMSARFSFVIQLKPQSLVLGAGCFYLIMK